MVAKVNIFLLLHLQIFETLCYQLMQPIYCRRNTRLKW